MVNQLLISEFASRGYAIIADYFPADLLAGVAGELERLEGDDSIEVYHDQAGQIRRMEYFTKRSNLLLDINRRIVDLLNEVTGTDFALFKDKYNFKPPGGEGFFAHYDGIFQFTSASGEVRNGWHHYGSSFVSALIALDDFTESNGALEIGSAHEGDFPKLLQNTQGGGSPYLRPEVEASTHFQPIIMKRGGVALFKHSCPHRSGVNESDSPRGSLYWTYSPSDGGDFYEDYFEDKKSSSNPSKALQGERFEG